MENNQGVLIKKAIGILNDGGIIIFPTDTAFGVGCRIDKPEAVKKIFAIRQRPLTQALPVLVSSTTQALAYFLDPSNIVRRFMRQYWPGALTIVDTCKKELIDSPIRAGGPTVGLRWPNHPIVQQLIEGTGVSIIGPSANIHKMKTPHSLADVDPEFIKLVDCVIPGECPIGQSSTVVDCSVNPYTIIRQGAVHI